MPIDSTRQPTADALLSELRELCTDVTGDDGVRARRLAVLRRLEHRMVVAERSSQYAATA